LDRTGEITRGMLVTDRREDESAYPTGTNRSEAQRGLESTPKSVSDAGVFCITHTPGPAALLRLLFHRVWGCEQQQQ
jgi:hypothetical protein